MFLAHDYDPVGSSSKCNTLPIHLYCLKTKGLILLTAARAAKPRHVWRLPLIPAEVSIKLKEAMEVPVANNVALRT